MDREVTCPCGLVVQVPDGTPGLSVTCACGQTVCLPEPAVPSDPVLDPIPVHLPSFLSAANRPPELPPVNELVPPALVSVRGPWSGGAVQAMAALSAEALWLQETWRLHSVPIRDVAGMEVQSGGSELTLSLSAGKISLTFATSKVGQQWHAAIEEARNQPPPKTPPEGRHLPKGVVLVQEAPEVPQVVVGRVEWSEATSWAADRGMQLAAGTRGADAVLGVTRWKSPVMGVEQCHASGLAVRVEDGAVRDRLRHRWFSEERGALTKRILLLLVIQGALLVMITLFWTGAARFNGATGERPSQALASTGAGFAMLYGWPLVLLVLLRLLPWPTLLRAVAIAVLVFTAGRAFTVWTAHFLASQAPEARQTGLKLWMAADPFEWGIIIAGIMLCVRGWRLAGESRQMLPPEAWGNSQAAKVWGRALVALTGAYALALLGFLGTTRYQASAHLLQPGVDPIREQEALLALNEGASQADGGDLPAAERSFHRSLYLWQELTRGRSSPLAYRQNKGTILNNLGWVNHRQGRLEEAEKYYAQAVALADELAGEPQLTPEFTKLMADARGVLAGLREDRDNKTLKEKDLAAGRAYEEAQVKAQKGEADAARLFREAINLWEEVLGKATNEEYRKDTIGQLAQTHLRLANLQMQTDRPAAEQSLKQAITHGEKSVALDPERPLFRHNLELARQTLVGMHEQSLLAEVGQHWEAQRFAEAVKRSVRGVEELEEEARSGKDREVTARRLAYRLNRLAWMLAHCPDRSVRDTRAAVVRACKATDLQPEVGDYWSTRATVQFRNGDWKASLSSLETLKSKENGLDASSWVLAAMNRFRLGQKKEAREALRKSSEWMDDLRRKGESDPGQRLRYELARPGVEALRQEAEEMMGTLTDT